MYRLLAAKGWGSAIVEAGLEVAGVPYELELLDPESRHARLTPLNPLAELPTLVLPDGSVMTESAAMLLHLADVAPQAGLAPAAGNPTRPRFLRWLVFLVAAVYPTFTFGDEPARYVEGEAAGKALRASTNARRETMWRQMEGEVAGPWFLGEDRSAIDIYVAVMTRWRPGRAWFEANTPKLVAVARAIEADPKLAPVIGRNFS